MPAKGTRKIIVDDAFLKKAAELSNSMFCDKQICEGLGIKESSFYELMKHNMDFAHTIKSARADKVCLVTSKFQEKIEAGDLGAMIFFLKCRGGWIEEDRRRFIDLKRKELELKQDELELRVMIASKISPGDALNFLEKLKPGIVEEGLMGLQQHLQRLK